jgi:putative flippase GtrA
MLPKKDYEILIKKILGKDIFKEGLKYLLVGGICTVFDFLILYLLVNIFLVDYVFSSAISFSFAVLLNYYLCTLWIFKVRKVSNVV